MSISKEAIEAAAKDAYNARPMKRASSGAQISWDGLSDFSAGRDFKENALAAALATITDATPHILAAARENP